MSDACAANDASSPPPPSWDAFTTEYEKRVEPFTEQFAVEMMSILLERNESKQAATSGAATEAGEVFSLGMIPSSSDRNGRPRLLDIGCGTGATSLLALSYGMDVAATDVSSSMVERTRQRAVEAGYRIKNVNCSTDATDGSSPSLTALTTDGQNLPTELYNSFDMVVANFSVIFFPDPVAGLTEMRKCLLPGGVASFTAWGSAEETPAFRVFPDVAAELVPELTGKPNRIVGSLSTVATLLEDAGFESIQVFGPVKKVLKVPSPEDYYDRFALTSPPNAEMIGKMDDAMKTKFKNRIMETARARGGTENGSIALDASAYIAYGRKPF